MHYSLPLDRAAARPGSQRGGVAVIIMVAGMALAGSTSVSLAASGLINAVGVENEYADVIAQVGGKYVHVTTIESDPNTDPHTFEASPKIAKQIGAAEFVVENGIGYDDWADKILAAAPNANRKVINVQQLLGLPDNTPNHTSGSIRRPCRRWRRPLRPNSAHCGPTRRHISPLTNRNSRIR
jgi:zinc/manganese transport system substrate-binding protein